MTTGVARGAGDDVCVTPAVRDQTAQQNAASASHRNPSGGAYGPNTCLPGYVFRDAYPGDQVCVTPAERDEAHADNAAASARKQANNFTAKPELTDSNSGSAGKYLFISGDGFTPGGNVHIEVVLNGKNGAFWQGDETATTPDAFNPNGGGQV